MVVRQVDSISVKELSDMAKRMYGSLVKAVIDIEERLLVVDAELHVDEEQLLLESGSKQSDLWGINLYPEKYGSNEFIEFDSMINIRPSQKNNSRGVEDKQIRTKITEIISGIVKK